MIVELLPPHTGRAFEAMRELRPGLASREDFVRKVDDRQRPAGYRLVATVVATRPRLSPWLGSTLPAVRQQGHAGALLAWLHGEAERLSCDQVHLDSGVGANRLSAHRLYFGHGYRISSHHFCREV